MKYFVGYLVIINLISFFLMFYDKRQAMLHRWRISERSLFLSALLGGSIGAVTGMWLFRHKTRHWYFVVGIPGILLLQAAALAFLLLRK